MTRKKTTGARKAGAASVARMRELQGNARRAAGLLKAMSNASRLVILCQLAEGESSVGQLEARVGITQSGISQHLAVLRREHVVTSRRDKQTIFYSLASEDIVELMTTLHRVFCKPAKPARAPVRASA